MVHGSIPLLSRRGRSLRHRRRFPNSNLSPARPLSGTNLLRNRQRRKRRNRRTKNRSIENTAMFQYMNAHCQETTCQKSALTFATYSVHPVSDGDREQVKITRREENGTEPGARRSEKGTEKPRRNRLHRTPTSRRIRRRAARTYDRLRFGAGDSSPQHSEPNRPARFPRLQATEQSRE